MLIDETLSPTLYEQSDHQTLAGGHCSHNVSSFAGREGMPIHLHKVEILDEI